MPESLKNRYFLREVILAHCQLTETASYVLEWLHFCAFEVMQHQLEMLPIKFLSNVAKEK